MRPFLRRHYVLLLSLAFGIAAFIISYNLMDGYVSLKPVVIAVQDIREYTIIEAKDVKVVDMPKKAVPYECLVELEDAVGMFSLSGIYKGQMIVNRQVSESVGGGAVSMSVPAGKRAMLIPVTTEGLDKVLSQGATVDIISAPKTSSLSIYEHESAQILPGITVLKVIADETAKHVSGVVVAATPKECLWVAEHAERGCIHFAVVSAKDGRPGGI